MAETDPAPHEHLCDELSTAIGRTLVDFYERPDVAEEGLDINIILFALVDQCARLIAANIDSEDERAPAIQRATDSLNGGVKHYAELTKAAHG